MAPRAGNGSKSWQWLQELSASRGPDGAPCVAQAARGGARARRGRAGQRRGRAEGRADSSGEASDDASWGAGSSQVSPLPAALGAISTPNVLSTSSAAGSSQVLRQSRRGAVGGGLRCAGAGLTGAAAGAAGGGVVGRSRGGPVVGRGVPVRRDRQGQGERWEWKWLQGPRAGGTRAARAEDPRQDAKGKGAVVDARGALAARRAHRRAVRGAQRQDLRRPPPRRPPDLVSPGPPARERGGGGWGEREREREMEREPAE